MTDDEAVNELRNELADAQADLATLKAAAREAIDELRWSRQGSSWWDALMGNQRVSPSLKALAALVGAE